MAFKAAILLGALASTLSMATPSSQQIAGSLRYRALDCNSNQLAEALALNTLVTACKATVKAPIHPARPPLATGVFNPLLEMSPIPINITNQTLSQAFALGIKTSTAHGGDCPLSTSKEGGEGLGGRRAIRGEHASSQVSAVRAFIDRRAFLHGYPGVPSPEGLAWYDHVPRSYPGNGGELNTDKPSTLTLPASSDATLTPENEIGNSEASLAKSSSVAKAAGMPVSHASVKVPPWAKNATGPLPMTIDLGDPGVLKAFQLGRQVGSNMKGCGAADYPRPTAPASHIPKEPTAENPDPNGPMAHPHSPTLASSLSADPYAKPTTPSRQINLRNPANNHQQDNSKASPTYRNQLHQNAAAQLQKKVAQLHKREHCHGGQKCSAGTSLRPSSSLLWTYALVGLLTLLSFCGTSSANSPNPAASPTTPQRRNMKDARPAESSNTVGFIIPEAATTHLPPSRAR